MALPAPHLDDLTFQQIVSDAKRKIGRRCPEWTDHNVSDPGVTLIELFARMTELTLYRMNQVPERAHIKFLEMLGVQLEPPTPASCELRFKLSKPIDDTPDDPRHGDVLPAQETVAATVRTDFEEAVEFATDHDVRLVRPNLQYVLALTPGSEGQPLSDREAADAAGEARFFLFEGQAMPGEDESGPNVDENVTQGFRVYGTVPQQNDTLWFGFGEDVSHQVILLTCDAFGAAGTGLIEETPAQVWEAQNTQTGKWERLEVVRDTTGGFNKAGEIEIALPARLEESKVAGARARWIRCRYTTEAIDHPQLVKGSQNDNRGWSGPHLTPAPVLPRYLGSPRLRSLYAQTSGVTALASNALTIRSEELGQSDGMPGQIFTLRHRPILARRNGETLYVGPQDASPSEMQAWMEVADFGDSGPHDRHFVLDSLAGEVRLGPQVIAPDGSVKQHGAVPERGETLRFSGYRIGGGPRGNVREREVQVVKSGNEYLSEVTNPRRATGGGDKETLDHAKLRAQMMLRLRNRAVTTEDFEYLALQASPAVGRAKCLGPDTTGGAGKPGVIRLLLVPRLGDTENGQSSEQTNGRDSVPLPRDLRLPARTITEVRAYLDERRLLTTVLEVDEPEYLFLSTDIAVVAAPDTDPQSLQQRLVHALQSYFHPTHGGFSGEGLPFGGTLTLSDVYAQIQRVPGVAFLQSAPKTYISRLRSVRDGILGNEEPLTLETEGLRLEPHQILVTRSHRVSVRSMRPGGQ